MRRGLCANLVRHLSLRTGRKIEANEALEQSLLRLLADSRQAWPQGHELSDEAFIAHVAAVLHLPDDPKKALAELHASDLFLACACGCGQEWAVREFTRSLLPPANELALLVRESNEFADELRQRFLCTALVAGERPPTITRYSGRCSLARWMRAGVFNTAAKMHREKQREGHRLPRHPTADPVDVSERLLDTDLQLTRLRHGPELEAALRAALAQLEPRARNLLHMHFVEGLSIDVIGRCYGVHRATAARWIGRIQEEILDATRARFAAALSLTPSEVASMVRLLMSQLDVSREAVFGTTSTPSGGEK